MALTTTTIGPVEKAVRNRLKAYRKEQGLNNYNEALTVLLDGADVDVTHEE